MNQSPMPEPLLEQHRTITHPFDHDRLRDLCLIPNVDYDDQLDERDA